MQGFFIIKHAKDTSGVVNKKNCPAYAEQFFY